MTFVHQQRQWKYSQSNFKHVDYSPKNIRQEQQSNSTARKINGHHTWTKHASKRIPIISLFVDPTSYSWCFPAWFLVVFLTKHKIAMIFLILWDSFALEDVHVLQDPKWRKKKLRRRLLGVLFLACLHILCPLRNAITPPKTMSLKSSGWTLTLKQGMCGVGSSIDFPNPKLQGLNYYGWGLRCVDHSKTITVKDQECWKQKNDLSISDKWVATNLAEHKQPSPA